MLTDQFFICFFCVPDSLLDAAEKLVWHFGVINMHFVFLISVCIFSTCFRLGFFNFYTHTDKNHDILTSSNLYILFFYIYIYFLLYFFWSPLPSFFLPSSPSTFNPPPPYLAQPWRVFSDIAPERKKRNKMYLIVLLSPLFFYFPYLILLE